VAAARASRAGAARRRADAERRGAAPAPAVRRSLGPARADAARDRRVERLACARTGPVAGGPTTTLTTEPDPFHGAWPSDLQVDATTVYVATDTGIVTMAATGGAMTQLVSEAVMNAQIAVDAEGVYWVGVRPCTAADGCNNNVGEVKRVPLGGGTTTVLGSDLGTQSGGRSYGGLVVDDASVYWVEESSGWVMKLPLAGGAATVIAQLQVLTTALASDAHNVY
jgi:hypothetical protein